MLSRVREKLLVSDLTPQAMADPTATAAQLQALKTGLLAAALLARYGLTLWFDVYFDEAGG